MRTVPIFGGSDFRRGFLVLLEEAVEGQVPSRFVLPIASLIVGLFLLLEM